MAGFRWSKEDNKFFKDNWQKGTKEYLLFNLKNRTWNSLVNKARMLGLKRDKNYESYRIKSKVEKLLNESNETYYWMGYLLADGSFYDNRLKFYQADKDSIQVKKFAKYIEYESDIINEIKLKHKDVIPILREKFNIKDRKTYNPPTLDVFSCMSDKKLISLIVGFIDGDGHIRKQSGREDYAIIVKCHSSWKSVLQYFSDRLHNLLDIPISEVNCKKYSELCIANSKAISFLKENTKELNLPISKRKWDIITNIKVSMFDTAKNNQDKILKFLDEGYSQYKTAKLLGFSRNYIYKVNRKRKEGKVNKYGY